MTNEMFPIFLKPSSIRYLIIGAGNVGTEKLHFLLKNSPSARVIVVSKEISLPFLALTKNSDTIEIRRRPFEAQDIEHADVIIAATNDRASNISIRMIAKSAGKLVNVADTPDLCDFYLGSIVTKGNLKIGISTNGKSPTFAKRLRQYLEKTLDAELIEETLDSLDNLRKSLRMHDFQTKLKSLNQITQRLVD